MAQNFPKFGGSKGPSWTLRYRTGIVYRVLQPLLVCMDPGDLKDLLRGALVPSNLTAQRGENVQELLRKTKQTSTHRTIPPFRGFTMDIESIESIA